MYDRFSIDSKWTDQQSLILYKLSCLTDQVIIPLIMLMIQEVLVNFSSSLLYIAPSISLMNKSVDALVRDPDIIGTYVSINYRFHYLHKEGCIMRSCAIFFPTKKIIGCIRCIKATMFLSINTFTCNFNFSQITLKFLLKNCIIRIKKL